MPGLRHLLDLIPAPADAVRSPALAAADAVLSPALADDSPALVAAADLRCAEDVIVAMPSEPVHIEIIDVTSDEDANSGNGATDAEDLLADLENALFIPARKRLRTKTKVDGELLQASRRS